MNNAKLVTVVKHEDGTYLAFGPHGEEIRVANLLDAEPNPMLMKPCRGEPVEQRVTVLISAREISEAEATALIDADVAEHEAASHAAMSASVARSGSDWDPQ